MECKRIFKQGFEEIIRKFVYKFLITGMLTSNGDKRADSPSVICDFVATSIVGIPSTAIKQIRSGR